MMPTPPQTDFFIDKDSKDIAHMSEGPNAILQGLDRPGAAGGEKQNSSRT